MEYGILFLLVIVALCYLETLFASSDNKYIGLILPVITFIATVALLILWMDEPSVPKAIFTLIFTNIPTYILLIIYKLKRKKK